MRRGHQIGRCMIAASVVVSMFLTPNNGAVAGARRLPDHAKEHSISVAADPRAVVVDGARGRIFVAHRGAMTGQITLIDARTLRILRAVTVGAAPTALALDERDGHVFVVTAGSVFTHDAGSVSMLDSTSGTVLRTQPGGTLPTAVAVDQRTRRVFVTTMTSQGAAVLMFNAVTGATVGSIPLGDRVRPLVLATGGGRLVVATSDDRVRVVDAATGRVVHVVEVGQGVAAVAIDAALERVFVLNQASNTLSLLDLATGTVVRTVGVGVLPSAMAVDGQHARVLVANTADNTVSVLDARDGTMLATVVVGREPQTILVDAQSGRAVVACSAGISILDATTGTLLRQTTVNYGVDGMAVDGLRGQVVISVAYDNTVRVIASAVAARHTPIAAGATMERTRAVVQAFVDAYNNHDVSGVLALLTDPLQYADCDATHHTRQVLRGKAEVALWLRARFAERDRWAQARVLLYGPQSQPPNDPHGAGLEGMRINDVLRAQGRVTNWAAKLLLTEDGSRLTAVILGCAP